MSTQPSTSDAPTTTSTTPAAPTSTDPTVTTSTPPVEAPSSTTTAPTPSSESPSTSTPSTPSTSKTDKQSKRTSLVKTFFKKLRDSSPNQRKPMTSSSKPTNTGTAPLNGEAPLSGSGAILENKDAEKTAANLSGSVDPTTAPTGDAATQAPGAGIVDQSHPGQIIPHTEKKHPGEEPVQIRPVRNPYHVGVLNEVDVLVTKEAEKIMQAMSAMVENSAHVGGGSGDIPLSVRDTLYPHSGLTAELGFPKKKWFENWASGMLDKLFAAHRMGVYVITDRKTKANIFETMPVFTRLGMHLLFVSTNHEILDLRAVEGLFKDVSFRQGKIYDNPDPSFVIPHIEAFIQAYDLKVDDLLEPDIKKYKTFNDFFKRSLKPGARPVQEANDLGVITSPADSRVTVFKSVGEAKKFWIKGQEFTLSTLLDDPHLAETFGKNPSIAIFRLAPQDYHRYHAPFKAKLGKMFHVPGTYFTVNPQAINEDLNVFTANRRDVQLLQADVRNPTFTAATAATASTNTPQQPPPEPVTFGLVAVGALLVGSIGWSKNPGDGVQKGEDLGFFQYGGSTVILVAPEGTVEWDEDLVANSSGLTGLTGVESGRPLETLVRVGERIGKVMI